MNGLKRVIHSCGGRRGGGGRPGFTLLEIVVTLALLIVLLPSVWTVFLSGQRYLTQMQERSGAASDVRLSLKGVADEIQEAIRLVHPQPGATTSEGVGFVSASGAVVFYFVDQRLPEGQRVLWRQDLVGGELLAVARNVKHFRATVPAVEPGIEPAFVNLDLSVLAPGAERDFNAITGVFLRAVEPEVPE
ncbi:MAG: type II secretion system protein [Candidatus Wallbacteria bacterium]|nr:type II secretion system protein [Candidatus Wallbacteria bacterium]